MTDSKPRLLIIDDDIQNLRMVQEFMSTRFQTEAYADPREGMAQALRAPLPALVLLDVDMPGLNGFEVCEAIRAADPQGHVSVIFMTSDPKASSMQQALKLGANDYVVKPVRMAELLSRMEARLGQAHGAAPLVCGNLTIDPSSLIARLTEPAKPREFRLSDRNMRVLEILIRNEGRIVTRDQLMDHAWAGEEALDRAVDLSIFRLRKVLRGWNHRIESVYGKGYLVVRR